MRSAISVSSASRRCASVSRARPGRRCPCRCRTSARSPRWRGRGSASRGRAPSDRSRRAGAGGTRSRRARRWRASGASAARPPLLGGVEDRVPALAVGRTLGHAGELVPARVVKVVVAVRQGRPHHLGHRFGDRPELQGAVGQRRPGVRLGGDVDAQQLQVGDVAVGSATGHVAHQGVAPVGARMGCLERHRLAREGPGEEGPARRVGRLAHDLAQGPPDGLGRRPAEPPGEIAVGEAADLVAVEGGDQGGGGLGDAAQVVAVGPRRAEGRDEADLPRRLPAERGEGRRRVVRQAVGTRRGIEHAQGAEETAVRAGQHEAGLEAQGGGTADRRQPRGARVAERSGTMTGSRPARRRGLPPRPGRARRHRPQAGAPGIRTIAKAVPQTIRARRAVSARSGMGGGRPACPARPSRSPRCRRDCSCRKSRPRVPHPDLAEWPR